MKTEKIGLRTLLMYAQGQMGLNLCATLLGLHLLYFYTDREGLSPSLAGLAVFLGLTLDALSDPLMGNISDRARFKSGRRRPFILLGAPPMALCYFLLLSPPNLKSGLFIWFTSLYFLMLTCRKLYETAYGALMPELTLDYDERTRLSTFRQLFATCGDISGALIPFAASYFLARRLDFRITGLFAGVFVAAGAIIVYGGIRERGEFSERPQFRMRESIRSVMGNRPFIVLLIATALAIMSVNIPSVLLRFLAKYWAGDENAAARWLIAYFIGSIASYPFWFKITMAFEKKTAFIAAIMANALGSLAILLLRPDNTRLMYLLMAFSGFSAIGMWVTQISASADVIEYDEERTGSRQEGIYAGLTSMAIKLAVAASMLLVGPMLSWVGYVPGAATLTPHSVDNLVRLFAYLPASIYFVGGLVFSRYSITRETHRLLRERIASRALPQESKVAAI